jgi:hypothetical protein
MRAPEDTAEEAEEYADAHGFRSTRPLGPGWTILGPIDDIGREEKQFPFRSSSPPIRRTSPATSVVTSLSGGV